MIGFRGALSALGIALACAGCAGKVLSPSPADQLRRQNADLSAKVESLERKLSEARTALAAAEQNRERAEAGATGASPALSPEAIEATPHLAGITIAAASHTDRPLSGDGCVARVYVTTVDGLGRFMQAVGTVSVTLYWSPPGCAAEVLACQEFGPMALRDAYRSGFGGTHYTLEWLLAPADPTGVGKADSAPGSTWTCGSPAEVKVEFTDARSGRVFTARRALAAMSTLRGDRQ
jgi:outer membrane murein-binding lipoprotein Lpp